MSNSCIKCGKSGSFQGKINVFEFYNFSENVYSTGETNYDYKVQLVERDSQGRERILQEDFDTKKNTIFTLYFRKLDPINLFYCDKCKKSTIVKYRIYTLISLFITSALVLSFILFPDFISVGGYIIFILMGALVTFYNLIMSSKKDFDENVTNHYIEKKKGWCNYNDLQLLDDGSFGIGSLFYIEEKDLHNFEKINEQEEKYSCTVEQAGHQSFTPKYTGNS